jgi:hypothetical protein
MLFRDMADLALLPDFTEAASDFSAGASPFDSMVEFRGLSVFPLPGILDRRERKERDESLVSDRLKDGYDCKFSSRSPGAPELFEDEPPSFEFWFPMILCQASIRDEMLQSR